MQLTDADPNSLFKVSTDLVVETPENVRLTYRLAGPAVRLLAYLIDLAIRAMILFVVFMIALAGGVAGAFGASFGFFMVVFFFVDWAYFGLSEALFRGKTIGKQIMGLRVFQEQGYPATIWGAMLRNLIRGIDNWPWFLTPLFGVALFSMLIFGRFRRLGDLVSQTVVIEERRVKVPREPVILEKIKPLPRTELGSYVPSGKTMSLIEDFLSRRHVLTYRRGHAMAHLLARPLADRLAFSGDPEFVEKYPMAFLAAVYATFHQIHDADDDWAQDARSPRSKSRRRQAAEVAP